MTYYVSGEPRLNRLPESFEDLGGHDTPYGYMFHVRCRDCGATREDGSYAIEVWAFEEHDCPMRCPVDHALWQKHTNDEGQPCEVIA